MPQTHPNKFDRWIPWLFPAGFLVVIAVNAVLVVAAMSGFSGLVVKNPYQKGVEYTRVRAAIESQEHLGWRCDADLRGEAGQVRVTFRCATDAGAAADYVTIQADLRRPVENMAAIPLPVTERGGGRFEAVVAVPKPGVWDLHGVATRQGKDYVFAERVVVP